MKIAYICYQAQERYTASNVEDEETILLSFLRQKGLDIRREVWTDPQVDWSGYDIALLKSPWDYFDRINEFYAWLQQLEQLGVRLLNPYHIVRWNSDKHYLKDIADAGFPVIPTAWVEKGEAPVLAPYFDAFGTEQLIIKPCVSGGAKNTFAVDRFSIAGTEQKVQPLLQQEAFMVQPFIREIQTNGEWSLIFFNGRFSHSLLKKPQEGDFRVQHYLGGTIHPQAPPAKLLDSAASLVAHFAKDCLYARVDGTVVDGRFLLMELELIEPLLFLFTAPGSYERYYQALQQLMGTPAHPFFPFP